MKFHPFAETFDWIEGEEWEEFVASAKVFGLKPIFFRMKNGEREGLDGRNRLRCHKELGTEPVYEEVKLPDDQVVGWIKKENNIRRQMTKAARAKSMRWEIEQARAEGDSIGKIAEDLNLPKTTVHRQLELSDAATPENVTSKDGHVRKGRGRPKKKAEPEAPPPAPYTIDEDFQPIPDHCQKAFQESDRIREWAKELAAFEKRIKAQHAKEGWEMMICSTIADAIKNARNTMLHSRATHVCPYCNAEKQKPACNCCKGRGWTTHDKWRSCPSIQERNARESA